MWKTFRTFYGFWFKKRFTAVVFLVLIVVNPLVDSIFPYFYKLFVDTIPTLDYYLILKILGLYVGVRLGSIILNTLTFFVSDLLATDGVRAIRTKIFNHIQDLDFAFHTNKSSGTLISIFKRGDGALWDFNYSIHFRIVYTFTSFFVMLYFFKDIDMRIFGLAVLSFLLAGLITWRFIKVNMKTRDTLNRVEDEFTTIIADNMINFETVKLYAKENWERSRLQSKMSEWYNSVWKFIYTFRYLDVGMALVTNISIFFMLLVALKLTIAGDITTGDFILVATFVGVFYGRLFEMVWGFRDLTKSYTDITKYFSVLDNEIEIKDPENPLEKNSAKGGIEFKNINYSYNSGTKNAIKDFDLKVKPGESIAFVGKSGSGKTTIVKMLMRFFDPKTGSVKIDGVDIRKLRKTDLRNFFGVVPQEPILFNNTIEYNIGYGKEKAKLSEIRAAAKLANINDFIESLPRKYHTNVGERGIKLSGGQKQRLAIARMILSDPDIIVFDEATSQLDSESEKLIQEAFWKASKGKTTFIIAHRLSTVMRADKIVVLQHGMIKEIGTHEELLKKKESLYSHFWNLQIKLD